MNIFYNDNGVGDVLLVQLTADVVPAITFESVGDVTLIKNEENANVVGFNLFNASSYVNEKDNGMMTLTESLFEQLKKALEENGATLALEADFTPKFVIGHVLKKEKHPNADKLNICSVDVGEETLQIVCGASNIDVGQNVVVAKVGAVMPSGMVIRDAELRGIPSSGMICSATELNLPNAEENTGILVLEKGRKVGEAFPL